MSYNKMLGLLNTIFFPGEKFLFISLVLFKEYQVSLKGLPFARYNQKKKLCTKYYFITV